MGVRHLLRELPSGIERYKKASSQEYELNLLQSLSLNPAACAPVRFSQWTLVL